jgi:glycyl-tRNA synthetase beta chain
VQRPATAVEVDDFIAERLRGLLLERDPGITPEMVDAVLATKPRSPLDAEARLQALKEFLRLPEAPVLTAINKRIGNILRKAPIETPAVLASIFTDRTERDLHGALLAASATVTEAAAARRYGESLHGLIALAAPVDEFFEHTMVMAEEPALRANRLALLREVHRLLGGVADLSRLPGKDTGA